MFFLLQDEVVQFNHICVLFDYTYDCNWTAQKNTHLLSKLVCGAINANDEVSTVRSMGARLFCIRTRRVVILDGDTTRGFVFGLSGNHKAIHQKTHAGEILTTVFFARVIMIFCHQGEDTGGRERGRMGSLDLMSLIFGGGKDVPDE